MVFRSRYNVRGEFEILPDSCSNPNHYTNQQGRFEEEVEAGMRDDLERMADNPKGRRFAPESQSCARCRAEVKSTIVSVWDSQGICTDCRKEERAHPLFFKAQAAWMEGHPIGLPTDVRLQNALALLRRCDEEIDEALNGISHAIHRFIGGLGALPEDPEQRDAVVMALAIESLVEEGEVTRESALEMLDND